MLSFTWLPGQGENHQENSFLAPSLVGLWLGGSMEHVGSVRVQNLAVTFLTPESR